MPGPFVPNDTLVGPVAHQIALFVQAQIPSINTVYEKLTDRPPGDNTVVVKFTRGKVLAETNGKMKMRLTYTIQHLFRRASLPDSFSRAYAYIIPWMFLLAAWPNQNLAGLAREVNATELAVSQLPYSGMPVVGLVVQFDVITEFNISLS